MREKTNDSCLTSARLKKTKSIRPVVQALDNEQSFLFGEVRCASEKKQMSARHAEVQANNPPFSFITATDYAEKEGLLILYEAQ